jgi:hypothetical protein
MGNRKAPVAAQISEGQNCDRRLVEQRQRQLDRGRLARMRPGRPQSNPINPERPGDGTHVGWHGVD